MLLRRGGWFPESRACAREGRVPCLSTTESSPECRFLGPGRLYFALVFGAGCVLGTIRILWVVPRVGTKRAELFRNADYACGHVSSSAVDHSPAGNGASAVNATRYGQHRGWSVSRPEFSLVPWLRGVSIRQYVAGRDPVAGLVYYLMLGVFAVMPLLVAGRGSAEEPGHELF